MLMLLFFTVVLIVLFSLYTIKRNRRYIVRVQKYLPNQSRIEEALKTEKQKLSSKEVILSLLTKIFGEKKFMQKWEIRLEQAGSAVTPEEFFLRRFLLGIGGLLIGLIFDFPFILLLFLFGVGYSIPVFSLRKKQQQRLVKFSEQLPQALRTMTTAIKAGFSIVQAIQLVGKEADDPIGDEFTRTIREINLGVPIEEAFENFAKRIPNDDLRIMVTAILIQRTVGGNLADILETVQQTIHERIKIKDELRALTAQGRMSAWVITLLPVVLALIINIMSPEYFSPMLKHPLGWAMLAGAFCSGALGWVVIQKIIKIEV